jgi:hypothetical protein
LFAEVFDVPSGVAAWGDEGGCDAAFLPPAGEGGVCDAEGFGGDSGWDEGGVGHGATLRHDRQRFTSKEMIGLG